MDPALDLPAVEYAERSDPGRDPSKQVNEDACGHRETRLGHLCVVCDGMGGHAAGREAAELALATIFETFEHAPEGASPAAVLRAAIEEASRRVHAMPTQRGRAGAPGVDRGRRPDARAGHRGRARRRQPRVPRARGADLPGDARPLDRAGDGRPRASSRCSRRPRTRTRTASRARSGMAPEVEADAAARSRAARRGRRVRPLLRRAERSGRGRRDPRHGRRRTRRAGGGQARRPRQRARRARQHHRPGAAGARRAACAPVRRRRADRRRRRRSRRRRSGWPRFPPHGGRGAARSRRRAAPRRVRRRTRPEAPASRDRGPASHCPLEPTRAASSATPSPANAPGRRDPAPIVGGRPRAGAPSRWPFSPRCSPCTSPSAAGRTIRRASPRAATRVIGGAGAPHGERGGRRRAAPTPLVPQPVELPGRAAPPPIAPLEPRPAQPPSPHREETEDERSRMRRMSRAARLALVAIALAAGGRLQGLQARAGHLVRAAGAAGGLRPAERHGMARRRPVHLEGRRAEGHGGVGRRRSAGRRRLPGERQRADRAFPGRVLRLRAGRASRRCAPTRTRRSRPRATTSSTATRRSSSSRAGRRRPRRRRRTGRCRRPCRRAAPATWSRAPRRRAPSNATGRRASRSSGRSRSSAD